MIFVPADEVRRLLPMATAIDLIEQTMIHVSDGGATLPLRSMMDIDGTNKLGIMPGALADPTIFGVKVLSLFPGNPSRGLSSHIGLVVIFDPDTGAPRAALDADAITAIRTAAASAAATRALARADARVLGIIGTGEQAETHIDALRHVRAIGHVRIAGRTPERAAEFVSRMKNRFPGINFDVAEDAKDAAHGADILCTVTSSQTVVLKGDWVVPGTHVNAVGASIPTMQEIDEALLLRSDLFVDYRPSALAQACEIIAAIDAGRMTQDHIRAEIGTVFQGSTQGRSSDQSITLYRSLGIAAQDLASADAVLKARDAS